MYNGSKSDSIGIIYIYNWLNLETKGIAYLKLLIVKQMQLGLATRGD